MSDLTFTKIEQSIKDRKRLHLTFLKNVKTYAPFLELEEKAFADGALDRKTKELMALSISIITKCEPCMEWHLDQAMQHGATDQESTRPSTWPSKWAAARPGPTRASCSRPWSISRGSGRSDGPE